ncbi:MAG: Hint domain-containing protein [Maritimibacter sp.]
MLHFRSPDFDTRLPRLFSRATDPQNANGYDGPGFAASGVAPSSLVACERGEVLARDLKPGDRLLTFDHGFQPLRWVGANTVVYREDTDILPIDADHGPVRLRAGKYGSDKDDGNLVMAPGQRVLIAGDLNETLFGAPEVLAAAGDLTHLKHIDMLDRPTGRRVHILLDAQELIRVNNVWLESLVPDMWSIAVGYPDLADEMVDALPRLRYDSYEACYVSSRPGLEAREAALVEEI